MNQDQHANYLATLDRQDLARPSAARLQTGPARLPEPKLALDAGQLWTKQLYTATECQNVIVQLVADGLSVPAALAHLADHAGGPVPTPYRIARWLITYPDFKENMAIAKTMRGEMMVEAALDKALAVTPDTAMADKTAIAHLQWHGSKLAGESYGEKKTVEVKQGLSQLSDEDINRRINDLISKKEIQKQLPALASKLEAAAVEVEILQEPDEAESVPADLVDDSEDAKDEGAQTTS